MDEATEFIWLNVLGCEPRYVHGTLANTPVNLGDLKLHDQVEVPVDDIRDWGYLSDGASIGFFSVTAIHKIQSE